MLSLLKRQSLLQGTDECKRNRLRRGLLLMRKWLQKLAALTVTYQGRFAVRKVRLILMVERKSQIQELPVG